MFQFCLIVDGVKQVQIQFIVADVQGVPPVIKTAHSVEMMHSNLYSGTLLIFLFFLLKINFLIMIMGVMNIAKVNKCILWLPEVVSINLLKPQYVVFHHY